MGTSPQVISLARSDAHTFSKPTVDEVELVAGIGVAGDAHAGARVRHRSRVAADPTQPNLRQVHLLDRERLDHLGRLGHDIGPGVLGENVTTAGIDLHALGAGTVLRLGEQALVALTGLRNPCVQVTDLGDGVLQELVHREDDGTLVRRGGVMGVVVLGGTVRVGDPIEVATPPGPHRPLDRVWGLGAAWRDGA